MLVARIRASGYTKDERDRGKYVVGLMNLPIVLVQFRTKLPTARYTELMVYKVVSTAANDTSNSLSYNLRIHIFLRLI